MAKKTNTFIQTQPLGMLRILLFTAIFSASLNLQCPTAWGEMVAASDSEMAAITGQGVLGFNVTGDVARIDFNIDAGTFTEIDSLKAGYYDDGITGTGWDQDWNNVSLGSSQNELVANDLYLEANFTNIDDPSTRTLQSVTFGTANLTGPMQATFISFSGDVTVDSIPIEGHRITPTFSQLNFDHTDFSISLVLEGPQQGFWVHWGEATSM